MKEVNTHDGLWLEEQANWHRRKISLIYGGGGYSKNFLFSYVRLIINAFWGFVCPAIYDTRVRQHGIMLSFFASVFELIP